MTERQSRIMAGDMDADEFGGRWRRRLFGAGVAWPAQPPVALALVAMALLLLWRHRENINRLVAGTESKIGAKKA